MIEGLKNLLDAIGENGDAKEALFKSWHYSPFRSMLGYNLTSPQSIVNETFTEDFPRVRSYRGTGPRMELQWSHHYKKEKQVRMRIVTDLVQAGVDIFMESDGCPGAETKEIGFEITVPESLVKNPTKTAFADWIKDYKALKGVENKAKAKKKIEELAKAHGLTVSVK